MVRSLKLIGIPQGSYAISSIAVYSDSDNISYPENVAHPLPDPS